MRAIVIDIDDCLSPPLVTLLNLVDDEILRIVVTARVDYGRGEFASTWQQLLDMGLRFDELHMRDAREGAPPLTAPGRYKAHVLSLLKGWGVEVLFAIDDNQSVGEFLKHADCPVVRVIAERATT